MKLWGIALAFAMGSSAHAGTCNQDLDPHSFDCASETFAGRIFPMPPLSSDRLNGPWALLTYSAVGDQPGPELGVLVNLQNPRIPEGVINRVDGSRAGGFDWTPGRLRLLNFGRRGQTASEVPGSTKLTDEHTVQTFLRAQGVRQGFQCRIFERVGSDHLLCRWFTIRDGKAVLRGFLGFLRGQ